MEKEILSENVKCIQKDSQTWLCRLNLDNNNYEDWNISLIKKSEKNKIKEIESALNKLSSKEKMQWICKEEESNNKRLVCKLQ